VQYCNCLSIFLLKALKDFLYFQSIKLNSTDNEDTYFVTDIRTEGLLGKQSAEFSGLKREEGFDSCEIYKKSFSRNNNISGHTSASGREMISRYQTCVTSFTLQSSEVKCFRGNELRFSCSVCRKRFASRCHLDRHTRVHTGERTFSCDVCKKLFTQSSGLKKHLRIHTGERPYPCKICKKTFTQSCALSTHMKLHTGKRLFCCKICNRKFILSSRLKSHLAVHNEEKHFSCDMCKKTFSLRSNLIMHLRVHTGEKPFSCKVCKRKFTQNSNLYRHLRMHTGEGSFSCEVCMKRFAQGSDFKQSSQNTQRRKKNFLAKSVRKGFLIATT
jgi:KRAB domain-containing zinc finger protein